MMKKVPIPADFDRIYCNADPHFTSITRRIGGNSTNAGVGKSCIFGLGILFSCSCCCQLLILVNINITRIMERSSEIGVRKAFGASSKTLVYQFIVENMILTFLGGIIGIVLSMTCYLPDKRIQFCFKYAPIYEFYCFVLQLNCLRVFWFNFWRISSLENVEIKCS